MSEKVIENKKIKKSSLTARRIQKLINNKLALAGFIITFVIFILAVFAPLFTKYDPNTIDLPNILKGPSIKHIFGTDRLGRDLYAQIIYGGRVSIYVGVVSAVIGTFIGVVFGGVAGYFGGKIDGFLVRFSEIFLTFPNMILVLILVALMGQGVNNLVLIFSLTGWMTTFRMIRNEFLALREETYVEACKVFGISDLSIIFKTILPNTLTPIMVSTTLNIAGYILQEAGLSFLGLGVPVTTPTWGNIMNASKSVEVVKNYWWLWLAPGATISIFVMAINFVGDGLRDVLDPRD